MFVIAIYDIHHKRVAKVRKTFKKYLHPIQKSVFEGEITESKLNALQNELLKIIDVTYDSITIYCLESTKYTSKLQIGEVLQAQNVI